MKKRNFNRSFLTSEGGRFEHMLKHLKKTDFKRVESLEVENEGCILTFEKNLPDGSKKGVQISKLFVEKGFFGFQYRFNFFLKQV